MKLSKDPGAVETIPLRLMIVAVVAALSVLPAAQALETLKTKEFLARAAQQLDSIIEVAEVLSIEGPGSVRTLSLDFSSSGHLGLERLSIGGEAEDANSSSVVLELTNGGKLVRTLSHEEIPISASEGGPVVVWGARFDLRMSAEFEDGTIWILAEVL